MRRSRPDLPDFDNPPVVEVYLSVQFEPVRGFEAGHLNACWQELRHEFPKAKHQLALAHELEQFGGLPEQSAIVQIQFQGVPEIQVRLALTSSDDSRLVQIQGDRFVHNWRKAAPDASYPRYEVIRERFENYFMAFSQILGAHGLGAPRIDQCEVSYINHIPAPEENDGFAGAARVFRQLQDVPESGWLPPLEDVGVRARYILRDAKDDPVGRLHTLMQPAKINRPEDRMFLFTLLVRGRPPEQTLDSALDFCDLGRVAIVRAFAALTTPEMHKLWGRRDAA